MASAQSAASTTKSSASDTGVLPKLAPLVPEHKKYVYKPEVMNNFVRDIVIAARGKKVKIDIPETQHKTTKLVHALCSAASANTWSPKCEEALADALPLREHLKELLSHNMFVTVIGALIARALEQATRDCEKTLDLLANRDYVRNLVCHDSSKTSTIEAAAYAGIMAVHMEKEALVLSAKKLAKDEEATIHSQFKLYTDTDALTTAMANFGLKHHYESNSHHPEHFAGGKMKNDVNVVEAIVDDLAFIFEKSKDHSDVNSWLNIYHLGRFNGRNKALSYNILEALKLHVTDEDYKILETFRSAIFSLIGESVPLSPVIMTKSCNYKTDQDAPECDLAACFQKRPTLFFR